MSKSFLATFMDEVVEDTTAVEIKEDATVVAVDTEETTTSGEVHAEEETSTLVVHTDEPVDPSEAEVVVETEEEVQEDGTSTEVTTVVVTEETPEEAEVPYEVTVVDETVDEEVTSAVVVEEEPSAPTGGEASSAEVVAAAAAMSLKNLFEKKLTSLAKLRNEFAPTYVRAFASLKNAKVDANKFSNIKVKKVSSYKNILDRVEAAMYISNSLANIKVKNTVALKNVATALSDLTKEIGSESASFDKKSLKDLGYTPSNLIKLANVFNNVANTTIQNYAKFATDVCNNVTSLSKDQKKMVKDINRAYTDLTVYMFGNLKMQLRKMMLALTESSVNPSVESLMVTLPKLEIPTIEEVTDFAEHKDSQESKTHCEEIKEIEKEIAPSTKDDELSEGEISKIGDDVSVDTSVDKPLPSEELAGVLNALATSIHLNGLNKQAYEFMVIFGVPDIMFKFKKHFPAVEDFTGSEESAKNIAESLDAIAEGILKLS